MTRKLLYLLPAEEKYLSATQLQVSQFIFPSPPPLWLSSPWGGGKLSRPVNLAPAQLK